MGWVTLDDGQHVYIGSGGKVLATRSAISSASGGKERGKALATRSKTAIGGVSARTARAIEHARAAGPSLREQAEKARAAGLSMKALAEKVSGKALKQGRDIAQMDKRKSPASIARGVPEAVSGTNEWNGRTYINLRHSDRTFRGDQNLKLWMDNRGVLIHEEGKGIISPPARKDRDAILEHAKKVGIRIEKR